MKNKPQESEIGVTLKEVVSIIKSGLVGAIALAGLCIISVIAFARSQAFSSLVETICKIVPSLLGLFAIIGGIGFIIGLGLRKRFPVIQRGILPLVIAFIMLALPLGFVGWLYHKAALQVEYPAQQLKLADCTNNVVSFHLNAPRGHNHQLELRLSGVASSSGHEAGSYNVSGHLRISSGGTLLTDLPISSDQTWLSGDGYILTIVGLQKTNGFTLSKLIQSHKDYDFQITLDSKPPTNSSIWIEWWESKIDK
jgi:hypothetical protein